MLQSAAPQSRLPTVFSRNVFRAPFADLRSMSRSLLYSSSLPAAMLLSLGLAACASLPGAPEATRAAQAAAAPA
ncbi:MAG: hypothetical protein ACM3N6_04115, partial [Betaproteobacteria bacterium]